MADMGYGLNRETVMQLAFTIAEKTGKSHPFKGQSAWFDNYPEHLQEAQIESVIFSVNWALYTGVLNYCLNQ